MSILVIQMLLYSQTHYPAVDDVIEAHAMEYIHKKLIY